MEEGTLVILQAYYEIHKAKQQEIKPTPDLSVLNNALFWDTDINKIDWDRQYRAVIQRVFERGNEEEKAEIIRFYGTDKVKFKQDGGWLAASGNEFKAKASYIEVPVHLVYKPQFGIGNLLVGAGPYAGYGTGGKWEAEGRIVVGDIVLSESYGEVIFKNDVSDGEFGNYLYGKPWDYGTNILIGYEFLSGLAFQFNAQIGVANLKPKVGGTTRDGSMRNKGYGISVGYRF